LHIRARTVSRATQQELRARPFAARNPAKNTNPTINGVSCRRQFAARGRRAEPQAEISVKLGLDKIDLVLLALVAILISFAGLFALIVLDLMGIF
jgi:hypothetical protein